MGNIKKNKKRAKRGAVRPLAVDHVVRWQHLERRMYTRQGYEWKRSHARKLHAYENTVREHHPRPTTAAFGATVTRVLQLRTLQSCRRLLLLCFDCDRGDKTGVAWLRESVKALFTPYTHEEHKILISIAVKEEDRATKICPLPPHTHLQMPTMSHWSLLKRNDGWPNPGNVGF